MDKFTFPSKRACVQSPAIPLGVVAIRVVVAAIDGLDITLWVVAYMIVVLFRLGLDWGHGDL